MPYSVNRDFPTAFFEERLDEDVVELNTTRVAGDNNDTNSFVVLMRDGIRYFSVNTIDKGYFMAYYAIFWFGTHEEIQRE